MASSKFSGGRRCSDGEAVEGCETALPFSCDGDGRETTRVEVQLEE